jgi:NADPH:quinone reductase
MRAVVLQSYDSRPAALTLEERPVPKPGPGQVLVKVAASPINPSDLDFIDGRYGFKKPLPVIPGFEGAGRVVATGSGLVAWLRAGKRVSCAVQETGDGCWAEYVVTSAMNCLPLPDWMADEQGAIMLVNPLTCYAMIAEAKKLGARSLVQSAAGGVLGQMLWRFGKREGLEVINVVRRTEQAETLRAAGMSHVLCSTEPDFEERLRKLCEKLQTSLAFDAVGGTMTAQFARALPNGSAITVYGQLAEKPPQVDTYDLVFRGIVLNGFWLSAWLKHRSLPATLWAWERVKRFVRQEMRAEVRARHSLDEAIAAVAAYRQSMSGGKVLLTPNA